MGASNDCRAKVSCVSERPAVFSLALDATGAGWELLRCAPERPTVFSLALDATGAEWCLLRCIFSAPGLLNVSPQPSLQGSLMFKLNNS